MEVLPADDRARRAGGAARSPRASARCSAASRDYVVSPGTYDQKHIDRIGHLHDCIAYGPGILDLAHQPDEWVGIDDMVEFGQGDGARPRPAPARQADTSGGAAADTF